MNQNLTIVMYHYVRDLKRTRFPRIKGRDLSEFRHQLDYIAQNYAVVTAEQVMEAALGGEPLPDNSCWLTFDDGYLDHYTTVFPLLHERKFQGSFFPPARPVQNGELMDVNKIQFILAQSSDMAPIIDYLHSALDERRASGMELQDWDWYWQTYAHDGKYDTAEVIFIKSVLQKALPEDLRSTLSDALFSKYVCADPSAFAAELYMSADQLRTMIQCGMYVGNHGNGHYWLGTLNLKEKKQEIDLALAFLRDLGASTDRWVMAYPYGSYDAELLDLLRDRNCAVGVIGSTMPSAIEDLLSAPRLQLPRIDTNDLPFS